MEVLIPNKMWQSFVIPGSTFQRFPLIYSRKLKVENERSRCVGSVIGSSHWIIEVYFVMELNDTHMKVHECMCLPSLWDVCPSSLLYPVTSTGKHHLTPAEVGSFLDTAAWYMAMRSFTDTDSASWSSMLAALFPWLSPTSKSPDLDLLVLPAAEHTTQKNTVYTSVIKDI